MLMNSLISVIIPVYNSEKYLESAVNSFTQQTYKNLEILCVDDGSTDESVNILESLAQNDERIKIYKQKNAGAGAARNTGLSKACGEYVYFFDSDDIADKKLIEKAYTRAAETDADIVAFNGYTFTYNDLNTKKFKSGFNKNIIKDVDRVFSYRDYPESILSTVNVVPWNKLIKRSFITENSIVFEEISSTNDLTFSAVCLAAAQRIALLDSALVYYRLGHDGTVTSIKGKNLQNVIKAIESAERQIKQLEHAEEILRSLYNFTAENYCFAFLNYTDDFASPQSKDFYESIKNRFSQEDFASLQYKDFRNKEAYAVCRSVKEHTYEEMLAIRSKRIIVSLTSYPERIEYVSKVVENIFSQTLKPDRILLWLSKEQFPNGAADLPAGLTQLEEGGTFSIKWCGKNLRSHKKYLYTMQEYPDDIIITVDDDLEYPATMIESLYHSYIAFPDCVSAMRVHVITLDEINKNVLGYSKWIKQFDRDIFLPSKQFFATTGAGCLFPPGILDRNAFNEEKILELCPYADDIWLNLMLLSKGIKTVCAVRNFYLHYSAPQNNSLFEVNVGQNKNESQYEAVKNWLESSLGKGYFYNTLCDCDNDFDLSSPSQIFDYAEYLRLLNAETGKKLKTAYGEKTQLNKKLHKTYDEKAERGLAIKTLEAENKKLKLKIEELEKRIESIENSKTYRYASQIRKIIKG